MVLQKIIGLHSCREALKTRSAGDLKKLYLRPEWSKSPALRELAQLAEKKKLKPETLSLKKLNRIGESHQGVCVLAHYRLSFDLQSAGADSVVLLLDRIQDPRNLGAIIRTAWLMAVDCIFISSHKSSGLSPSAIKSASGGVEHVPVEVRDNLRQCLEELKRNQFWTYALDSQSPKSLWNQKFDGRLAFLLGGEGSGLKRGLKSACDEELFIPQKDKSASYNVSVTAGVILAECFRQKALACRG